MTAVPSGITEVEKRAVKDSAYRAKASEVHLVQEAVAHQQPKRAGMFRPKLRYAHQGGMNPPLIVIHGNSLDHIPEAYKRYLIKDESGREVIDPNAPLPARDELYEYQRYKAAAADLPMGGAKSVILAKPGAAPTEAPAEVSEAPAEVAAPAAAAPLTPNTWPPLV